MANLINWLNENAGAITGLATLGTLFFTAAAAAAAWTAIHHSKKTLRSRPRLQITFDRWDSTTETDNNPALTIWNVGNTTPLHIAYAFHQFRHGKLRQGGGNFFKPPKPGEPIRIDLDQETVRQGTYITITWLDQDGRNRKESRWYKFPHGDDIKSPSRRAQRSDLGFQDPLRPAGQSPRPLDKRPPASLWLPRWKQAAQLKRSVREAHTIDKRLQKR